jgi:ribosomal protein L29
MAKTKTKDTAENLRQLDVNELKAKLETGRVDLFELRLKRTEQKNPLKVRWARRNVARIMTLIKEKTGGTAEKTK